MNNDKYITSLKIIDKTNNIFTGNDSYIIPFYQRAYAWTSNEIIQLIDDIYDNENKKYYLGSLIVAKKDNQYEVVDGQQRLTTLFLLLKALNQKINNENLTFACREKSNETLAKIDNFSIIDDEKREENIIDGYIIIQEKINAKDFDKDLFIKKIENTYLYRIEVPENTDLNHYFEIMNTRMEQLNQHDILKNRLMGYLDKDVDKTIFALIWDACSDMTGYVQMHFSVDDRGTLFGNDWENIPTDNTICNLKSIYGTKKEKRNAISMKKIIKSSFEIHIIDGKNDNNEPVRFNSIIEFPYFLLHTLKVFIKEQNITNIEDDKKIIDELLDDKKLTKTFDNVIEYGIMNNKRIKDNKKVFSMKFIYCLLKNRYLFDKYLIKREYKNEDEDGKWSLKQLKMSNKKNNAAYYVNTLFNKKGEWEKFYLPRTNYNLMLQSCLRVSYTSPKIMHWITNLLIWLNNNKNLEKLSEYQIFTEQIAKDAVKEQFLDNNNFKLGVDTPHIVLNYLDFIIWKQNIEKNINIDNFTFEFRNSVEHWYPRNPSDGTFDKWNNVDTFGNLCIIQRNVNSKFSNMAPEAKKSTYKDMINKGSLKLQIMSRDTISSDNWKEKDCQIHENNMLSLLTKECQK